MCVFGSSRLDDESVEYEEAHEFDTSEELLYPPDLPGKPLSMLAYFMLLPLSIPALGIVLLCLDSYSLAYL